MGERLVHRDDLEPETLEAIQAKFPDMKIVCAGDIPDGAMPENVKSMLESIERANMASFVNGTCIDCGTEMPGFDPDREDWQPAKGWRWFTGMDDVPVSWQCPVCDAKEE